MTSVSVPALPGLADLHIEALVTSETSLTIVASVAASTAVCPDCAQPSARIHSLYVRRPRELPWAGVPVQLTLQVRRFFCDTSACSRITFAEQVAGLTRPYAQRTVALNTALQSLGLALGGQAGARLAPSSASWALQRRSCGAFSPVHLNLLQHRVSLGSMTGPFGKDGATVVSLWIWSSIVRLLCFPNTRPHRSRNGLRIHPSVEVIARDRTSIYTEALAKGARRPASGRSVAPDAKSENDTSGHARAPYRNLARGRTPAHCSAPAIVARTLATRADAHPRNARPHCRTARVAAAPLSPVVHFFF
jgi:hypothetical protein